MIKALLQQDTEYTWSVRHPAVQAPDLHLSYACLGDSQSLKGDLGAAPKEFHLSLLNQKDTRYVVAGGRSTVCPKIN